LFFVSQARLAVFAQNSRNLGSDTAAWCWSDPGREFLREFRTWVSERCKVNLNTEFHIMNRWHFMGHNRRKYVVRFLMHPKAGGLRNYTAAIAQVLPDLASTNRHKYLKAWAVLLRRIASAEKDWPFLWPSLLDGRALTVVTRDAQACNYDIDFRHEQDVHPGPKRDPFFNKGKSNDQSRATYFNSLPDKIATRQFVEERAPGKHPMRRKFVRGPRLTATSKPRPKKDGTCIVNLQMQHRDWFEALSTDLDDIPLMHPMSHLAPDNPHM
jgi:hypothetical protein